MGSPQTLSAAELQALISEKTDELNGPLTSDEKMKRQGEITQLETQLYDLLRPL